MLPRLNNDSRLVSTVVRIDVPSQSTDHRRILFHQSLVFPPGSRARFASANDVPQISFVWGGQGDWDDVIGRSE